MKFYIKSLLNSGFCCQRQNDKIITKVKSGPCENSLEDVCSITHLKALQSVFLA